MTTFRETDLKQNLLKNATVAILGFGNQGHAHALNLRDSGVTTVVGTRRGGTGWEQAAKAGFDSMGIGEATEQADMVVILLPDEVQGTVFHEEIQPALKPDTTIAFSHGFTIAFGVVEPPPDHDIVLCAPKGQGHYLRQLYMESKGLPCLVGVAQDHTGQALQKALSYAALLGCLAAGAIETTFEEEAVTDLFGEQSVLCGGVPELVKAAFDTLVERGYKPEVAYLECLHELKIITDLMYQGGVRHMREHISRTAAWGSFQSGARIVTPEVREVMRDILKRIESGEFARGWMKEAEAGLPELRKKLKEEAAHASEKAGKRVRGLMPYLEDSDE